MTWPTIDTVSTSISGINSGFFALPSTDPTPDSYRILRKSLYSDLVLGELYMQPADRFLVGTYTETTLEGIGTTEIDTTDISFAIGLNMAYSIVIPSGPPLYTFWS